MKTLIILLLLCGVAQAQLQPAINLEALCDAIFWSEGGYKASRLYGIMIPYKDEAEARQICKNTIVNTLYKYRADRCKVGESNIDCLARRYAPIGAKNDPTNLNVHWKKNVRRLYKKYTGEEI